jgi:hypothetical protein
MADVVATIAPLVFGLVRAEVVVAGLDGLDDALGTEGQRARSPPLTRLTSTRFAIYPPSHGRPGWPGRPARTMLWQALDVDLRVIAIDGEGGRRGGVADVASADGLEGAPRERRR